METDAGLDKRTRKHLYPVQLCIIFDRRAITGNIACIQRTYVVYGALSADEPPLKLPPSSVIKP